MSPGTFSLCGKKCTESCIYELGVLVFLHGDQCYWLDFASQLVIETEGVTLEKGYNKYIK